MTRSRVLDQLLLLIAAIMFSTGGYVLMSLMEGRGVPDRMGFFVGFNILVGFVVTWQGVVLFRRRAEFWFFYGCWSVVHIFIYGAWGYSGNRIELCAFTLPLEAYWFYRIATARFRRDLENREPST